MKIKSRYYCEYCNKTFVSKPACEKHEKYCIQRISDNDKLERTFRCLMRYYEKKGYSIAIRYDSRDSDDCIIALK